MIMAHTVHLVQEMKVEAHGKQSIDPPFLTLIEKPSGEKLSRISTFFPTGFSD